MVLKSRNELIQFRCTTEEKKLILKLGKNKIGNIREFLFKEAKDIYGANDNARYGKELFDIKNKIVDLNEEIAILKVKEKITVRLLEETSGYTKVGEFDE